MPRLYGAPSYSRPPHQHRSERPFDPDDLPLEAHRTDADIAFLTNVAGAEPQATDSRDAEAPTFLRRSLLPFGLAGRRP
jgi:hypothetical protein